jgi:hypothetical protein
VILAWRIELTATATKQLAKLDKGEAKRISTFLRQRLATREQDLRKAHPARRIGDDSTDVRLAVAACKERIFRLTLNASGLAIHFRGLTLFATRRVAYGVQ